MQDVNSFCHLHLHSQYSLLDGENKLDNLVNKAKSLGMKSIAITDHGTMMGVLNFYKACKKVGLKPVIGVEAYVTQDPDDAPKEERTRDNHHLVMIAKNNTGYQNLLKLVSKAQLNNFYYKPRISKHNLTIENTEGIIVSSACMGGAPSKVGEWSDELNTYTKLDAIKETALWYKDHFKDGYYLEIQDNDDAAGQQKQLNNILISVGKQLDIPVVITSDAHYTEQENSELHSMIMAMQLKKTFADYKSAGEMKYGPWFYIRSPEEMLQAAKKLNHEEAFWNVCKIAESCDVSIETGTFKFPVFDIESSPDYKEFLETHNDDEH
jgi:DNA polymerase-3 subunit alpha